MVGCAGQFCAKVGGDFDRYSLSDIEMEVCYDAAESKTVGAPVYRGGNGDKFIMVHENHIKRADEIIAKAENRKQGNNLNACMNNLCGPNLD